MPIAPSRGLRLDEIEIANLIKNKSRVLDIGCGDGILLRHLTKNNQIDGRGIELSQKGVNSCVTQGLSVVQGDADTDLKNYPQGVFDFVILSQTLQATRNPKDVLLQLIRIGKRAIVTFPNFGYLNLRLRLLFYGEMPKTAILNQSWYDTTNIHLCTILDFVKLCEEIGITIEKNIILNHKGKRVWVNKNFYLSNLFGQQALFVLTKK